MKMETNLKRTDGRRMKICFFGHFGMFNSGNESTLRAILYNLRRFHPDVEVVCICDGPEAVAAAHKIEAVPISSPVCEHWNPRNRLARWLRRVFMRVPNELWRYVRAFKTLKGTDMLIIPGTGLLTDAYGLQNWGPYSMFKWSLMTKMRRCKLLFVSVGVGPLYTPLGRWFVGSALFLADFRSYRDEPSMKCVEGIGRWAKHDRVYPDLVFSLPEAMMPHNENKCKRQRVVGLGLMDNAGRYSVVNHNREIYAEYLESLVIFVKWLLAKGYDIRLLIGDACDMPAIEEFKSLLNTRLGPYDEKRIINEPTVSVEELLPQIAASDFVVATRFHNVLLALLLNHPVIAISFHPKCTSLMSQMGLSDYCHDINHMDTNRLIEQFQDVERNAAKVKLVIRQGVEQSRKALEEQYNLIFNSA
jgi:polysaccharide pyruvyl transferase WcaK-like protein